MFNDFIMVLLDKGDRKRIEDVAEKNNQSVTQFCSNIILEKIKQECIS